jgi:5-methyltetrahydropteroyltriglutamate--homocysteine methyltransferase
MNIHIVAPGLCSRNEELVRLTRAADLGTQRVDRRQLELAFLAQAEEFVSFQRSSGFSYVSDGQLKWKDLFRPVILSLRNATLGPLTRWLETNTFFRPPVVRELPKPRPGILPRFTHSRLVQRQYTLEFPGPYTFAACSGRERPLDARSLMIAYASCLEALLSSPSLRGLQLVCLNESYLPLSAPNDGTLEAWASSLRRLEGFRTMVCLDMVDASRVLARLSRMLQGEVLLKVDLTRTPLQALEALKGQRALALGVVDVDSSLLEHGEQLARFLAPKLRALDVAEVYLAPSADLRFLPYELAKEKLKVLRALSDALASLS